MPVQAVLSSSQVPHVRGYKEPVYLSPFLPFGVGRGGPVGGGRPDYRVSSSQRDGELVRLKVPVPRKDVGVIPQALRYVGLPKVWRPWRGPPALPEVAHATV
eukprot:1351548-Amphidinium_carterae.1